MGKPPARILLREDSPAVSDVLGSILMVGITVAMAIGFGLVLFAFKGPANTQHTSLAVTLDPGPDGTWGNGNEEVRVTHLGGEPLAASGTTFVYRIGTGSPTTLSGNALASGFCNPTCVADGKLVIGERWSRTATLALSQPALVQVIVNTGDQTHLLSSATAVAGQSGSVNVCLGDVAAPTVATWLQTPADVTSATTGTVTVQATLADNCAGINPAVTPNLFYCISATCPAPSAPNTGYTGVAMTRPDPTNQPFLWQGVVPSQTWTLHVGKTLAYYVSPLTDLASPTPNTGRSTQQVDPITVFTQYNYAASHVDTLGTVNNFPQMQTADALEATLSEGISSGVAGSMNLNANAVVSSGSGWGTTANALTSDGNYATNGDTNPGNLQLGLANPVTTPGTVTQVILRAEVNILGANNDGWQLQACIALTCSTASSTTVGTQTDSTVSYDITAARPGGGAWSWTDITNLELRVIPIKAGSRDGTWQVDNALVNVTYAPTYGMTLAFGFGTVPSGTHTLDVRARIAAGSNSFLVQTGSACAPTCAWTTRYTVSQTTLTTFNTYVFNAAEITAGYQVRVIQATADQTPNSLFVEYARVNTV
jgi:Archaeal Type IV pilin, N-terminal